MRKHLSGSSRRGLRTRPRLALDQLPLAIVSEVGKRLRHFPVETNGATLVGAVRAVPGHRHLISEEGTQSAWLYETLARHVQKIVVTRVIRSRGQKSDRGDAHVLAEKRTGPFACPDRRSPWWPSVRPQWRLSPPSSGEDRTHRWRRGIPVTKPKSHASAAPCVRSMRPVPAPPSGRS